MINQKITNFQTHYRTCNLCEAMCGLVITTQNEQIQTIVGDEKDPDEADTVGATTLRKEHIKLTNNAIEFDFLGKDSVRWRETIPAEGLDKQFHDNLKELISNKKDDQEIFDGITSRHVNATTLH